MEVMTTQVLVVGAGPAGLATAIGLAEQGVNFVILDAVAEAQNTSRAAVVHAARELARRMRALRPTAHL